MSLLRFTSHPGSFSIITPWPIRGKVASAPHAEILTETYKAYNLANGNLLSCDRTWLFFQPHPERSKNKNLVSSLFLLWGKRKLPQDSYVMMIWCTCGEDCLNALGLYIEMSHFRFRLMATYPMNMSGLFLSPMWKRLLNLSQAKVGPSLQWKKTPPQYPAIKCKRNQNELT